MRLHLDSTPPFYQPESVDPEWDELPILIRQAHILATSTTLSMHEAIDLLQPIHDSYLEKTVRSLETDKTELLQTVNELQTQHEKLNEAHSLTQDRYQRAKTAHEKAVEALEHLRATWTPPNEAPTPTRPLRPSSGS